MKLLFCQSCGDIFAPPRENLTPRGCRCGQHYIWWEDGQKGIVRVYDHLYSKENCWLLGITNSFLMFPEDAKMDANIINLIIDSHDDYYLFKRQKSCIVRFRPGETSDSAYANALPHT